MGLVLAEQDESERGRPGWAGGGGSGVQVGGHEALKQGMARGWGRTDSDVQSRTLAGQSNMGNERDGSWSRPRMRPLLAHSNPDLNAATTPWVTSPQAS